MAENKPGFIMYKDSIHTVFKLNDEVAGKVLKATLAFVNGEEYIINDFVAEVVFEPIRQQLMRDDVKYNLFRSKQAKNGSLGGRPQKKETEDPAKIKTKGNPNNPSLIQETQKSLRERDREREIERDMDRERESDMDMVSKNKTAKKKVPIPEYLIEYPFTEVFRKVWVEWKNYKKTEFKFNYKSGQSEQAALQDLTEKSNGVEKVAVAIIQQSMANGWKGFFELKNSSNGNAKTQKEATGGDVNNASAFSTIDRMHSGKSAGANNLLDMLKANLKENPQESHEFYTQ